MPDELFATGPKQAVCVTSNDRGQVWYRCPHCEKVVEQDDCDVLGADEDCLFCAECNGEFRT